MAHPDGVDPLRCLRVRTKALRALSSFPPPPPVKAKGVFYCCSSVCADIHCAGSEWLWWDVHDLHIAYGK